MPMNHLAGRGISKTIHNSSLNQGPNKDVATNTTFSSRCSSISHSLLPLPLPLLHLLFLYTSFHCFCSPFFPFPSGPLPRCVWVYWDSFVKFFSTCELLKMCYIYKIRCAHTLSICWFILSYSMLHHISYCFILHCIVLYTYVHIQIYTNWTLWTSQSWDTLTQAFITLLNRWVFR